MSTTSQQPLRLPRSDHSPLWLLVPFVICAVMAGVSLFLLNFGPAAETDPAAGTEATDVAPVAIEQHGA